MANASYMQYIPIIIIKNHWTLNIIYFALILPLYTTLWEIIDFYKVNTTIFRFVFYFILNILNYFFKLLQYYYSLMFMQIKLNNNNN